MDKNVVSLVQWLNAGNYAEVEKAARKVLQKFPAHALGLKALATGLIVRHDHAGAIPLLEQALCDTPKDAELHANLGIALLESGRSDEAVPRFHRALTLAPGDADNYANLGAALTRLGLYEEAEAYCNQAIALQPDHYAAYNALGAALLKRKKYTEATHALAKAIEHYPGDYYPLAVGNLGIALADMRSYGEAQALYQEIHKRHPEDSFALAQLVRSSCQICQWGDWTRQTATLEQIVTQEADAIVQPFSFLAMPGFNAAEHRGFSLKCANQSLQEYLRLPPIPLVKNRQPDGQRRLRVAYLSADLQEHATTHLLAGVFEHHDRERFEMFAYSYGQDDGGGMRQRLMNGIEHFYDIQALGHRQAAERIRDDGIDLLIDLKGWTMDTRMEILAQRPAPVLLSWLGYPGSLGHPRLADYILGDPVVTPLAHAEFYSETLALMPDCYQPNDRNRQIGSKPERADVGLPEQGLVLCSFNQSYKINPPVFDLWCRLLRAVEDGYLWLLNPGEIAKNNLRHEAHSRGVDPERLIFAPRLPLSEHLGRLQCADLALDTFPYGSHTTGSDALWAGVPLLACMGDTFASRVSASLVTAAGMPELVATSLDEYFMLALRLVTHPDELMQIRQRLANNRMTCALFDTESFTRNLERLFMAIWEDHLAGEKRPIVLPSLQRAPG